MLVILPIDPRDEACARSLHAVQMLAYRQEAELLGASRFPPLQRTVDDLRLSAEQFLGAFLEGELVGALSVGIDDENRGMNIASLVVHPGYQRKGIGRELLIAAVAQHGAKGMTVQTGARNVPALALYHRFGFKEYRRWIVGTDRLELVKLNRPSTA